MSTATAAATETTVLDIAPSSAATAAAENQNIHSSAVHILRGSPIGADIDNFGSKNRFCRADEVM
jgi:hypothetical protein